MLERSGGALSSPILRRKHPLANAMVPKVGVLLPEKPQGEGGMVVDCGCDATSNPRGLRAEELWEKGTSIGMAFSFRGVTRKSLVTAHRPL